MTLDLMILLVTVESVISRAIRAPLHHDEEIQIAPPFLLDPVEHPVLNDVEQCAGDAHRQVRSGES